MGNLLSAGDNFSQYAYAYDVLDRVTTSDNAGTPNLPHLILNFAYDAVGNLMSVEDNSGVQVASSYDARDMASRAAGVVDHDNISAEGTPAFNSYFGSGSAALGSLW